MVRVIGIDIDAKQVTASAVDADDGEVVSRARTMLGEHPTELAVLADPEHVFAATRETLHKLVKQLERVHDVRAIGLTGWPGAVLLDKTRQPTTAPDQAAIVVPVKDYVGMRLTGVLATDITEPLHVARAKASLPSALAKLESPPSDACTALRGALSEDVARSVQLADGIPVVRGATRVVARMIGMGATHPQIAAAWLEQDAALALAGPSPSSVPEAGDVSVLRHALPDQWCVLAKSAGAGAMLDWYCNVLCDGERMAAELRRSTTLEIILEAASTSRPGAGGVVFTGHALVGMTAETSKADLSRALLEGAAFSLRKCLRTAMNARDGAIGQPLHAIERVRLAGPWGESAFFRQLVADVLDLEVETTGPDAAALGAAALAAVGVRSAPDVHQAAEAWIRPKGRTRPEPATSERYRDVAAVYDELTAALSEPRARLAKLP